MDQAAYELYARNCRKQGIQPMPQRGTTPAMPAVPTQQHESARRGYAAIAPNGGGQYSTHPWNGGGGGRGGRGGRGGGQTRTVTFDNTKRAYLTVMGGGDSAPAAARQLPGPNTAPTSEVRHLHEQASRIDALPSGLAPSARVGFGWQNAGLFLEREESELYTMGMVPTGLHMPEAHVTTRSTQVAAQRHLQSTASAASSAGGQQPSTAAEAAQQLKPAGAQVDAVFDQLTKTRQLQLMERAAQQQHKRVVPTQLRPQPEPFTTFPMPSNVPASNLPDPVRRARADAIALPGQAPTGLEQALTQAPHISLAPDTGAALSLQTLVGLGTGVLEGLIAEGYQVCFRAADGQGYDMPLSTLQMRLPLEVVAKLHQHQAGGVQAAPAPEQRLALPSTQPAGQQATTGQQSTAPTVTVPEPAPVHQQAATTVVSPAPSTDTFEDGYDSELDEQERQGSRPPHLACYNMVKGVVVATSERVPSVYSFPSVPPPMGATFRATPDGPNLITQRAILDTGANVVLASKGWAEKNNIAWQPTGVLKLRTSSGGSFTACGRLSQPLIVVFCAGTRNECKVALDCYVMEDQTDLYELLLGTPLVNAVGGDISSFDSSFIYRPELHKAGGDISLKASVPICTYTSSAGDSYKESNRFLLGAVSAWVGV